jgi:hypothetical protein
MFDLIDWANNLRNRLLDRGVKDEVDQYYLRVLDWCMSPEEFPYPVIQVTEVLCEVEAYLERGDGEDE